MQEDNKQMSGKELSFLTFMVVFHIKTIKDNKSEGAFSKMT